MKTHDHTRDHQGHTMSRRFSGRLTGWGLVVVGVVVAALLIATLYTAIQLATPDSGTTTSEGTDAHHTHDNPLSPEHAEPETVATNALSVVFSWQPGRDRSGWDALARAAGNGLLTGELAKAAAAEPNPLPRPMSEWAAWARSGDTVTGAAAITGEADVSGTTATVPVLITQTVLHPGGDSTPLTRYPATVTLERDDTGTWRAANYRIEDRK